MKFGSIVRVVVDRPDGTHEPVITKGEIGVVVTVLNDSYEVKNHFGEYWYTEEQMRELTDEECRDALRKELMR